VLDLAKMDAGELRVVAEPVKLRPLIQAVADMLAPAAQQKGLALSAEVADDVPSAVIADPLRLCQILWNLVGNAIKFTEQGFIRIRLDAEPQTAAGVVLLLYVEDSGIGIPEAAQAALFQPFRQAEERTAQRFGGAGLGLSIARRLAGMMGGTITLASRPGEGSTFTVRLPVAIAAAATGGEPVSYAGLLKPPALPLPYGDIADAAGDDGATGEVLVAEDDPLNRILIEGQLGTLGLSAQLCADGEEAWECLQQGPVRLLITDLQMPSSGDGVRLARRIRGDPRFRDLPIIGLTADARPASIEACLLAGMNHVLVKPLRLPDLPEALRRLGIPCPAADDLTPSSPMPTEPAPPVFDPGNIIHAFGAIDAAARRTLDDFADQAAAAIEAVNTAALRREAAAVQQSAHRMAGSSASIGAMQLACVFAGIDAAAAAADWSRIDGLAASLERCLADTRAAFACCGSAAAPADGRQLSAS